MKSNLALFVSLLLLCFSAIQCASDSTSGPLTEKFSPTDPFARSIQESEFFILNGKENHVVEGKRGTVIVVSEGSFLFADGSLAKGQIKLELAEALSLSSMLLSNLTTTSEDKLLETDGMLYINATSEGKQLIVNPEKPLYIEVPTKERKAGMMAYKGERDSLGNMNWINPKEIENYLVPIDIDLLDFLPYGFKAAVESGMPFRKHKTANPTLVDSLYYSLTPDAHLKMLNFEEALDFNEPYNNINSRVVDGAYTEGSFVRGSVEEEVDKLYSDSTVSKPCGVAPASIKVIHSPKYEQTLLSTREFEARLQTIFKSCRTDVLELYIQNLDKNLWEIDSMAMKLVQGMEQEEAFENYYKEKLTRVEGSTINLDFLSRYYEKQLEKVEAQLTQARKQMQKALDVQNKIVKAKADDYKKLLFKREKHRMQKYGFIWTSMGWINVDRGTLPKNFGPQPLEVLIANAGNYDQVYTYVVYTALKSLYRLNTEDNQHFHVGNSVDRKVLMPKHSMSVAIAIGYLDDRASIGITHFTTGNDTALSISLKQKSLKEIVECINSFDHYSQENRIGVDLEYMAFFAKEKKRQEKLKAEAEFVETLVQRAYPCCGRELNGQILYTNYCTPCHKIDRRAIGPALGNAVKQHPREWLVRFTQNNAALRKGGDHAAINSFQAYNGSVMPVFENLNDQQINAIFDYIELGNELL